VEGTTVSRTDARLYVVGQPLGLHKEQGAGGKKQKEKSFHKNNMY
jgi:hypothetical protein